MQLANSNNDEGGTCLQGPAHTASLDLHGALGVDGTLLIPEEDPGSRRPGTATPRTGGRLGATC